MRSELEALQLDSWMQFSSFIHVNSVTEKLLIASVHCTKQLILTAYKYFTLEEVLTHANMLLCNSIMDTESWPQFIRSQLNLIVCVLVHQWLY